MHALPQGSYSPHSITSFLQPPPCITSFLQPSTLHHQLSFMSSLCPLFHSSNLYHFSSISTIDTVLLDPNYFLHTSCIHLLACLSASSPANDTILPASRMRFQKQDMTTTFLRLKSSVTAQGTEHEALPAVLIPISGHFLASLSATCAAPGSLHRLYWS